MSYDPMDVFRGAVFALLKHFGFYASVIVVAVAIAVPSSLVASYFDPGIIFSPALHTAKLDSNLWLLLDLMTVGIGYRCLVRWDKAGYRTWIILVGLTSLAARLGEGATGWLPHLLGWVTWLVLLAVAATGSWFIHQWQVNRWAVHMARVNAETAVRNAERDSRQRQPEFAPPPPPPSVVELKWGKRDS